MTENAYITAPATALDWHEQAACASTDPNLFFPPNGDAVVAKLAKRVCADCPVRELCLEEALDFHPIDGIWGGTTVSERKRLAKGRPTGRPSRRNQTFLMVKAAIDETGKAPSATIVAARLGTTIESAYKFISRIRAGWVPLELSEPVGRV